MVDIRERIKEALDLRGMMPIDLSRASGINKGSISKYLRGDVYLDDEERDAGADD